MNINNRLAKNDVKNTYDYSPRSIMKHQLREDPRRKKKGEGKRIKISNARNPMRSSRIHVVGLLSMIEPIVKSPIFHLCNETRAMVRPVERQRERERKEGEEGKREMRTERIRSTLRGATSSVSREGASTTGPVLFQAR